MLDGDEVRRRLTKGLGFSKADRDVNIDRIAFVAGAITRVGGVAITCAISPYRAARDAARREIGGFVEVYVECPVDVCIKRDVKGLYQKAIAGEIPQFTGVSDPYEPPVQPEVTVHAAVETPDESVTKVMNTLVAEGFLDEADKPFVSVMLPRHLIERLRQAPRGSSTDTRTQIIELLEKSVPPAESDAGLTHEKKERALRRLRTYGHLPDEPGGK